MHLSRHFDQIAIALSAICIVHCLALPIVVTVLPIAALSLGDNQHFHGLMLWVVVPTSLVGLLLGYRLHQRAGLVALGALGMAVLAAAATYGHAGWPLVLEVAVSVAGSLMLGAAHWLNFREVRRRHRHGRFDPSRVSASD
jgi:MerC mercury resistance protein